MARNEQLIRQHKILQILERVRFGKTLEEIRDDLTEELGLPSLHLRTVRRDLEALQAAGLDVDSHETQRGKVWKLGPRAHGAFNITASSTELIALSVGRDLMFPLAGTQFWIGIESFWNKIREELPAPVLSHYEKYREILHVIGTPAKSYEKQQGILSTLNRAILEHRIVEIEYQSLGKPAATRKIEPLAVALFQSSIYIIAAACEEKDPEKRIRHWKLDRFHKATIQDEWFKVPEGFDLKEHLSQGMGIFSTNKPVTFRVRVSAYAAPWVVEDPWHPEQHIDQLKDGRIEVTIKAAHELEIIPRVLSFGGEAEIIAPKSTRTRMKEMLTKMLQTYED